MNFDLDSDRTPAPEWLDDNTVEAILARRHSETHHEELTAVVRAIRSAAATTTPRPSAGLATLLDTGLQADGNGQRTSPATGHHTNGNGRGRAKLLAPGALRPFPVPVAIPTERRRKPALQTIFARVASLGLAAKIGLAGAAVAAATTGAGAAGVLPGPVQDAVADVVRDVMPFEFPSSADDSAGFGGEVAEDATDGVPPGDDATSERSPVEYAPEADSVPGPDDPSSVGTRPGTDATDEPGASNPHQAGERGQPPSAWPHDDEETAPGRDRAAPGPEAGADSTQPGSQSGTPGAPDGAQSSTPAPASPGASSQPSGGGLLPFGGLPVDLGTGAAGQTGTQQVPDGSPEEQGSAPQPATGWSSRAPSSSSPVTAPPGP